MSLLLPERRHVRLSVLDFWGNREVGLFVCYFWAVFSAVESVNVPCRTAGCLSAAKGGAVCQVHFEVRFPGLGLGTNLAMGS
jgi:hypothetical protein